MPESDTVAWFSFGLAALSLILAVVVFWQDGPFARRRREQRAKILVVATRALVFWTSHRFASELSTFHNETVKADARLLEDALYDAVKIGLWKDLVGRDKQNGPELFASFVTYLTWAHSTEFNEPVTEYDNKMENDPAALRQVLRPPESKEKVVYKNIEDYAQLEKLFAGVARLIDQCRRYETGRPDSLAGVLGRVVTSEEVERAWNDRVIAFDRSVQPQSEGKV